MASGFPDEQQDQWTVSLELLSRAACSHLKLSQGPEEHNLREKTMLMAADEEVPLCLVNKDINPELTPNVRSE